MFQYERGGEIRTRTARILGRIGFNDYPKTLAAPITPHLDMARDEWFEHPLTVLETASLPLT